MKGVWRLSRKTALAALAILFFIGANTASYYWFHRFDLTANQLYSLSLYSEQTAAHLPTEVEIKTYFSRDLPPEFTQIKEQAADLLKEYKYFGPKIKLTAVNPGDGQEAEAAGLPKLQFNDVSRDKLEVINGYLGIVLSVGDKKEVIPIVEDATSLEYRITSALIKLTISQRPTIGWLKFGAEDNYGLAKDELKGLYEIKEIDLTEVDRLSDLKTLIIADPDKPIAEKDLKKIDDYIVGGGSVLVLADRMKPVSQFTPLKNTSNIFDFLKSYGLEVDNRPVLDKSSALATFSGGFLSFNLPYAYWLKLINQNFDANSPAVSKLDGVVLPWATEVKYQGKTDNLVVVDLAKSTTKAWQVPENSNLSPDNLPAATTTGQYTVALGLRGGVKSAYDDRRADQARIIVVGDADFAKDDFVQGLTANSAFFANLVDSLALDSELSLIRSKAINGSQLKPLDDRQRYFWRYLNVAGLPFLTVLAGVVYYFVRRKGKDLEF